MIVGLDRFGLTAARLRNLSNHTAVSYSIQLPGPDLRRLAKLPVRERRASVRNTLTAQLAAIRERFSFASLVARDPRNPWTIDATSDPKTLTRLARSGLVSVLSVESVSGIRKRRLRTTPLIYTVRALIAIQVEGQTRGMQTVEETFVSVRARSESEAANKLERYWSEYGKPYLNPYGQFVRWQLERVIEVHATFEEHFNPNGTEVFSFRQRRRLTPERVWANASAGSA